MTIDGFFLLSTQPIHGKLISHIHGLGAMSLSLRFKTVPSFILYSKKKVIEATKLAKEKRPDLMAKYTNKNKK